MIFLIIIAASAFTFYLIWRFSAQADLKTPVSVVQDETDIPIPLTPKQFAEKYMNQQCQLIGGTLCFWGHWFGRPYDNFHEITRVEFDALGNILTIYFSSQETLTVVNPAGVEEYKTKLQISTADKVNWQWYYNGGAQAPENLYFYQFIRVDNLVIGSTNVNWHKPDWSDLSIRLPAVLLT